MKLDIFIAATAFLSSTVAFVPSRLHSSRETLQALASTTASPNKPTGTSFLPAETVERCKNGSPVEKAKMEKDPMNAFVDVYEYARKIREGEMTWEEVEKADLDTVRTMEILEVQGGRLNSI